MAKFAQIFKSGLGVIRSYDSFGKSITFTYKGSDKFQSLLGGLMSIAIFVITGVYLIYLIIRMQDNQFMSSYEVVSKVETPTPLNLKDKGFEFALWSSHGYASFVSYGWFYVEVQMRWSMYNFDTQEWESGIELIPYAQWSETDSVFNDYQDLIGDALLCPVSYDNITLAGYKTVLSSSLSDITIMILPCSEIGETCDPYVLENMDSIHFNLFVVSHEFDPEDYSSPVKKNIYGSVEIPAHFNYHSEHLIYVSFNTNEIEGQPEIFS